MDDNRPVTISLTGKVSYTDAITVTQAAQVMALIESADVGAQMGGLTSPSRTTPLIDANVRTAANPREALANSGAKTNPERIVALALHLAETDGKETFTAEDIKPLFRRAREATPKNFTRDLDGAIRAGWIDGGEKEGEYYVTQKAIKVLETTFEPLRGGRSSAPRSNGSTRRTTSRSTDLPDDFKSVDTIEAHMAGVIEYHKVKKKTEKVLWAIAKAKEVGVKAVTGKDLAWLTDRLGDGIAVSDMSANYRSLHKAGYVNKRLQDSKMRITPDGEAYLSSITAD